MRRAPTIFGRRGRRAGLIALALAAAAAVLVPATGLPVDDGPGHGAHFRLAWLANDPGNSYDNAILAGIEAEAARSQSTVDPYFAGFDPATQLAQCQEAVASGSYDGLLVIAASNTEIVPCVEVARSAGIPVAAVDLVIGEDQTTVQPQVEGVVAAALIPASEWAEALDAFVPEACAGLDPCEVFYLAGLESFPIDQLGLAAVQQGADESGSIELVGHGEAFYDTATANAVMAQALVEHPEIDLVIASGDQMALGAEQAATQAGVTLRIVGAGAGASSLDAVRAGRWLATFTTLPRTEGTLAARLLVRALRVRGADPVGVNPVEASGLPVWWTAETLAEHPDFAGEWPGP